MFDWSQEKYRMEIKISLISLYFHEFQQWPDGYFSRKKLDMTHIDVLFDKVSPVNLIKWYYEVILLISIKNRLVWLPNPVNEPSQKAITCEPSVSEGLLWWPLKRFWLTSKRHPSQEVFDIQSEPSLEVINHTVCNLGDSEVLKIMPYWCIIWGTPLHLMFYHKLGCTSLTTVSVMSRFSTYQSELSARENPKMYPPNDLILGFAGRREALAYC